VIWNVLGWIGATDEQVILIGQMMGSYDGGVAAGSLSGLNLASDALGVAESGLKKGNDDGGRGTHRDLHSRGLVHVHVHDLQEYIRLLLLGGYVGAESGYAGYAEAENGRVSYTKLASILQGFRDEHTVEKDFRKWHHHGNHDHHGTICHRGPCPAQLARRAPDDGRSARSRAHRDGMIQSYLLHRCVGPGGCRRRPARAVSVCFMRRKLGSIAPFQLATPPSSARASPWAHPRGSPAH
jgi:hypothetical protein